MFQDSMMKLNQELQAPHHGNSFLSFGNRPTGGWKKLGSIRDSGTSLDISNIPNKRYYKFLYSTDSNNDYLDKLRMGHDNVDFSQSYAWRRSLNDAIENAASNQTSIDVAGFNDDHNHYGYGFIANYLPREKPVLNYGMTANGLNASTTPQRSMTGGKWAYTTDIINLLRLTTATSTPYVATSEFVLLGWDPEDTHTDNFYNELANSTLEENASNHEVVLSSTQKYLWFEWWGTITQTGFPIGIQLGDTSIDTGSNYSVRASINGGDDLTFTNTTRIRVDSVEATPVYMCGFCVNTNFNPKLFIIHIIIQRNDDSAQVPSRIELVGKWGNTTDVINRIRILRGGSGAQVQAGARFRVFGGS